MGIKRVIIHLGMPKAGSSSIQATLYNNAAVLEKSGFRYLTEWGRNHVDKFHSLFHCDTFLSLGFKNSQNRNAVNKMLKVIRTSDCETLILSGEFFQTLYLDSTIENIKTFIKQYSHNSNIETTIIYYVRNPLTWIISWMHQILFSSGYLSKNADFFETAIKQYNGIFKLQTHFNGSLKLIKFEDACLDKDGFVVNFLTTIDFPKAAIKNLDMSSSRVNESRCAEVIEFVHFVEAMEASDSFINYKRYVRSGFYRDIRALKNVKGVKFDLPYQSKAELWGRLRETVTRLKESACIDYTAYTIPPTPEQQTYSERTIQDFIEAFPQLNLIIQKYFLKFFEKKYMETAQEKFKQLHFKGSIPYTVYKQNYSFFGILKARKNNMVRLAGKVLRVKAVKS